MHAILAAGGVPREGDSLYPLTQGKPKALLEVGGRPMLRWVLDALGESRRVGRIQVVGIEQATYFTCARELGFMPEQGGFLQNVLNAGLELIRQDPAAEYLLSISADIPAIRGDMIDEIIDHAESRGEDFYYCVIDKRDMQARFPGSRRTYLRFRDAELCGGDVAVIRASLFSRETGIWERLMAVRKSPWKIVGTIGLDVLLLFLLRRLSIDEAVRRASRRLGLRGCAIPCRRPEVGMDVDKPEDLAMMESFLRELPPGRDLRG